MRNRSGVFAAIFLASCKDLFSIICIYFSLGERPEKTEVSSVWLDYLSSPKRQSLAREPDLISH